MLYDYDNNQPVVDLLDCITVDCTMDQSNCCWYYNLWNYHVLYEYVNNLTIVELLEHLWFPTVVGMIWENTSTGTSECIMNTATPMNRVMDNEQVVMVVHCTTDRLL
jgi:hypothetical protein